ncbi:MAG: OmpH family outer membrane protein [Candidatus Cloacimonetes bacterium]|nr:OmpH family outer membrane protein [Candidatus Cloacimonadota bacterium]MBL7085769.1 OmpH family outer membrane protein [Candidatus Cloacimonadota bacterium]
MTKKILCLIITTFTLSLLYASDIKIAYLDVDRVYNEYPAKLEAEEKYNLEAEQWQNELEEKEQEINSLQEEYDNLPPIVTEERKEEKLALIEKKEREYYQFVNEIRNRAVQRQNELLQPISEKIVQAINEVAEDNKYDFVLNSQQGEVVLYAKDKEMDITDLVIEKLKEITE